MSNKDKDHDWLIIEYPAKDEMFLYDLMAEQGYKPKKDTKVEFGMAQINRVQFVKKVKV